MRLSAWFTFVFTVVNILKVFKQMSNIWTCFEVASAQVLDAFVCMRLRTSVHVCSCKPSTIKSYITFDSIYLRSKESTRDKDHHTAMQDLSIKPTKDQERPSRDTLVLSCKLVSRVSETIT